MEKIIQQSQIVLANREGENSAMNNQDIEITQVSINGWTDKRNVVYTYNGIYI